MFINKSRLIFNTLYFQERSLIGNRLKIALQTSANFQNISFLKLTKSNIFPFFFVLFKIISIFAPNHWQMASVEVAGEIFEGKTITTIAVIRRT